MLRDAPVVPMLHDAPVVVLEPGQSIDRALREFANRIGRAGLFEELRRRRAALSPSAARRRKAAKARERERRRARRAADERVKPWTRGGRP